MSQPKGLRKRRLVDLASRQSHSEFLLMSLSPNLCCLLPLSEDSTVGAREGNGLGRGSGGSDTSPGHRVLLQSGSRLGLKG